jgi:ketosteroid isomerase-like protein
MRTTMYPVTTVALIMSVCIAGCASAPTYPSPREVIEAKFDAVNRHALADVVARYAPDAQVTASNFCAPRHGRADVERIYRGIFAALPDVAADVQEYIVEGDRVAVRFVVRSRAAGASFQIPIINVFTVRDGLIVRDEGRFDNGGRACIP